MKKTENFTELLEELILEKIRQYDQRTNIVFVRRSVKKSEYIKGQILKYFSPTL